MRGLGASLLAGSVAIDGGSHGVRRCRRGRVVSVSVQYEILVDRSERPQKCSILPLANRSDFRIIRFDRRYPIRPLSGHLLLHPDGVALNEFSSEGVADADSLVLCAIDCNWRRLSGVLRRITGELPEQVRIPEGFETAYPRRNKKNLDPDSGLATIEALFLASAFLGVWDESLLHKYPPGAEFLRRNSLQFDRYGLGTTISTETEGTLTRSKAG